MSILHASISPVQFNRCLCYFQTVHSLYLGHTICNIRCWSKALVNLSCVLCYKIGDLTFINKNEKGYLSNKDRVESTLESDIDKRKQGDLFKVTACPLQLKKYIRLQIETLELKLSVFLPDQTERFLDMFYIRDLFFSNYSDFSRILTSKCESFS